MRPATKSHTVSRGLSTVRDRKYTDSIEFLKRFFGTAEGQVELRRLENNKNGTPKTIFTRDDAAIGSFCQNNDTDGYGCYFGVCTRRKGAPKGDKENCVEAVALWVDIDALKEQIPGDTVLSTLAYLPHPPSIVVNSGGGIHAYWMLEEPVDVSTESARAPIEEANRRLAMVLAGDLQCAEVARIMRLPGTHNSKDRTKAVYDGQPALCEVIEDNGGVHDLETLSDWLTEQRVLLKGTIIKKERRQEVDDPYLTHAKANGYQPPIDIDAELDAMEHEGSGSTSIHETQLRVTASMVARGYETEEIVSLVLAATERAAPQNANWNWRREEKAIRGMIEGARKKSFDAPKPERPPAIPQSNGNAAVAVVHDLDAERKKRREKPKTEEDVRQTQIIVIGRAVISVWEDRYGPIMHTAGTTYAYEGGIWQIWNDALAQRLRAMIQEACESLSINPTTSVLNAARAYVMDRPTLRRDSVEFDAHGLLIAEDAALDLSTMQVTPHSPDHYALFKVSAKLDGDRKCETWHAFLRNAWSDRGCASEIVLTLQEWFGASIAITRARPLLKGLLVHGPSRSGKTQVSKVMRALLGERHICNAMMRDLEGRFGKEPLIGRRGWIADDAIGAKEYLDAETYKVVVTGEDTSAQMKGGKNWEGRFGFPVLLTANNLPRVNDKSDATYNRSLILPMTVVRDENAPEPPGYDSIADKIIAEELTGVLWWAIEGRRRLFARGFFTPPAAMTEAKRSFQDSNDPIGSWIRQCVEPAISFKVARKDLSTSFNGWWEMESDDGKPFSSNSITREIIARFPNLTELKVKGERMFGGIKLNEEGLFAWESRVRSSYGDKTPAYSSSREEVNRIHAPEPKVPPEEKENVGKPRF